MSAKISPDNYFDNLIEKVQKAGHEKILTSAAYTDIQDDIKENLKYIKMMKKWSKFMDDALHLASEGYFGDDFSKDENFYVEYIDDEDKIFLRVESPKFINRKAPHKSGEVIFKKKQSIQGTEWKTCKFSDLFLPIRQSKSVLDTSMQKAIGNHLLALVVHKENLDLEREIEEYREGIKSCQDLIEEGKAYKEELSDIQKLNKSYLRRLKAYNKLSWYERLFSKI